MNNFEDKTIPEVDENLELGDLQNGVEAKEKAEPDEILKAQPEDEISEEEKKVDVVEVEDTKNVDNDVEVSEVNEVTETERKSFQSENERLVEIEVKTKSVDREETESLKGEEVVENIDDTMGVSVEDKESLLLNDEEDSEKHKNYVTTV